MTELDPVEGRQRETNLEIMTTGSNRRATKGGKPGIMPELDPVEGRQRETNVGDQPGNHNGT